jgi:serine/threonine protein phosphatase 1
MLQCTRKKMPRRRHFPAGVDFRQLWVHDLPARLVMARPLPYSAAQKLAMIEALRQLFRPKPSGPLPAIPAGERVYAIGDVHGRLDLFEALVTAVEADDAARGAAATTIVLLGDLVDRGPHSAGVVTAAHAWQQRRKVRIIAGNHEEMFLRCFDDVEILRHFLRFGGRETILSYPVDGPEFHRAELKEAQELMVRAVPGADRNFMSDFEDRIVIGDYLFVHAGIRPGVPLDEQTTDDLRWIREPFLSFPGDHGHVVVHGHTITETPEIARNRIGIDTGAYMHGRLTALGLEGTDRWLIQSVDNEGAIACETKAA